MRRVPTAEVPLALLDHVTSEVEPAVLEGEWRGLGKLDQPVGDCLLALERDQVVLIKEVADDPAAEHVLGVRVAPEVDVTQLLAQVLDKLDRQLGEAAKLLLRRRASVHAFVDKD